MDRRTYLTGLLPLLAGLSGCTDSGPSVVSAAITDRRGPESPFSLAVDTVQKDITEQQPGQIKLTVTNTVESRASYETGPPEPFGIVGPGGPGGKFVLWSDAYRESSCIDTDGRQLDGACDIGPTEITLLPGEGRSRTYEVREDPGTYTVLLEIGGVTYELDISVE